MTPTRGEANEVTSDLPGQNSTAPDAKFHKPKDQRRFWLAALLLLIIWLPCCIALYWNVQTKGCTATLLPFEYGIKEFGCDPAGTRLEQPFEIWIDKMNVADCAWYMRAGIAFASGHGISVKTKIDGKETYVPYSWQGPGEPFLMGCSIKLFGNSVFPLFIFACIAHWVAAFGVMILAHRYTQRTLLIFIAGLLSLLCVPVLNYDFGLGLVQSEIPIEPLFVLSLLALQFSFDEKRRAVKRSFLGAFAFGLVCGIMSYFRPSYAPFAVVASIAVAGLNFRTRSSSAWVFMLTAIAVVNLVQLPWQLRNQKAIGRFTMSGSQYRANALGRAHWMNWKVSDRWCPGCRLGLGDYIDPQKTTEIALTETAQPNLPITDQHNKVTETEFKELARAVWRHPLKALWFKFSTYDVFWLGFRSYWHIRLYCMLSLGALIVYLWREQGRIRPELYVFPLFALVLSMITHYEPRYLYPLHLVVTPICLIASANSILEKRRLIAVFRDPK